MLRTVLMGLLVALNPLNLHAMTLEQAVQRGVEQNPLVTQAQFELEESATGVDIARDGYLPQVSLSAGPERLSFNEFGYDLTAQQMLYDWGRVSHRVDNASAQLRLRQESYQRVADEAALDTAEVYLDVLAQQRRLHAVENYQQRLQEVAELARSRSEVGYSDRAEIDRVLLEQARAQEQAAIEQGNLLDARFQFRELIGQEPLDLQSPVPPALIAYLRARPDIMEALILASPLFRQSEEQVVAALAETEEARAATRPQLNLEGSLLRRELGGVMQDDAVIALRLRMDTFQGLSNFRRITSASQRLEAAKWSAQSTRRDVVRELNTLIELNEALALREQALNAQVNSAREVVLAYEEQFSIGLRDVFDLVSLQRDLFEAERQLVELSIQKWRTQYRAAAQLGLLNLIVNSSSNDLDGLVGAAYAHAH